MTRYAYYEDTRDDVEVSGGEIAACSDVALLRTWEDGFEDLAEDIRAQISGVALTGIRDDSWIFRACQKLGWTKRGVTRIRRRLKELGVNVRRDEPEIEVLRRDMRKIKSEAAVAVEFLRIAEQQMVPAEFAAVVNEATTRVDKAEADRKAHFAAQAEAKKFAA